MKLLHIDSSINGGDCRSVRTNFCEPYPANQIKFGAFERVLGPRGNRTAAKDEDPSVDTAGNSVQI